jgi:alpha-N-acetylglucosaminidase
MELEDTLLGTNEFFLLGRWLSYLPAWSTNAEDRKNIAYDAHSILTTWGDRTASTDLHEYGNKDWAGLVSTYYAPRWKLYFDSLDKALADGTQPAAIDWYSFGDRWNRSTTQYAATPQGDSYAASLAIAQMLKLAPTEAR